MSETLNTYQMNDLETLVPMDRDEFYKEQIQMFKETGRPTRATDIIAVLIFNSKGEVLLQKRSYEKGHNAGLIDKSLGGHVVYGDTVDFSVMVETVQELQTPSLVLRSKTDFERALLLLEKYLTTTAVIRHVGSDVKPLVRIIDDEPLRIAYKVHMFFGMYDGRVKPADGEAQGVLWYALDNLQKELEKTPEIFTNDIMLFLDMYSGEIQSFLKYIEKENIS